MSSSQNFIRDANGATYRIGALLGRGLFARTFTARGEDGVDWIVKIALGPTDFPEDMLHLVKISRAVMDEQWQILSRKPSHSLLAPAANFISEDGRYCLLYPRYDVGFKQLMGQSRSLPELLRILARCAQALNHLPSDLCPHGNIHPNNVFWDGQHVLFMDPLTPLLRLHHADLLKAKGLSPFTPPEYRHTRTRKSSWSPSIATDTHGLALLLMGRLVRDCELEVCTQGLTKLLENNLSQSIQLLLDENPSANIHFHERVSRQIIRLLDRALNSKWEPSPPFRFANLQDFQQRLQNIIDLINPTVSKVGPILFGGPLGKGHFQQDDEIRFSCSIHTTPPLEDHEDITAGTIVVDLNRNGARVEGYDLWVEVSRLNGGRLRFQFGIVDIPPGDYGLFLGFRVNGSLATPKQEYAEFHITANVGYEPPIPSVPPKTLQFPSAQGDTTDPEVAFSTQDNLTSPSQESAVLHSFEFDDVPESLEAVEGVDARHPLLQGRIQQPTASNATIKIPDLSAVRPKMELPESEFASVSEPLSMIHPLPRPLKDRKKRHNTLTVVAGHEGQELTTGAIHSSPFTIQLESLIELSTNESSEVEPSEEYHKVEEYSHDYSQDLSEYPDHTDFTDGFSESIGNAVNLSEEHSSERPRDNTPAPKVSTSTVESKKDSPQEDVQDVVRETVNWVNHFVKNDPFASTIIGLVVLILLLGGVFLALL
mgnify:CR=1 FL=1